MKKLLAIILLLPSLALSMTDYTATCSTYVGGNGDSFMKLSYWLEGYFIGRNPGSENSEKPGKFSSTVYDLCLHLREGKTSVSILDAAKAAEIIGGVR